MEGICEVCYTNCDSCLAGMALRTDLSCQEECDPFLETTTVNYFEDYTICELLP